MSNKIIKTPELLDGVKQNKLYPESFFIPDKDEIDNLKPGNTVKVSAEGERFWVEIIEIEPRKIIGRIDNDLVRSHLHDLFFDDLIEFKQENIINIF